MTQKEGLEYDLNWIKRKNSSGLSCCQFLCAQLPREGDPPAGVAAAREERKRCRDGEANEHFEGKRFVLHLIVENKK